MRNPQNGFPYQPGDVISDNGFFRRTGRYRETRPVFVLYVSPTNAPKSQSQYSASHQLVTIIIDEQVYTTDVWDVSNTRRVARAPGAP